jgi:alpha-N-arabinofuranosidase
MKKLSVIFPIVLFTCTVFGKEYHVSTEGLDTNDGSLTSPFKTISSAAQIAQPGDVITVHAGTYREGITPPRERTIQTNRHRQQKEKSSSRVRDCIHGRG